MIEVLYMIHPLRNATWIRMYLGPVYTKCQMMWQLRNDVSNTTVMENNGVAQTCVAIPFWSDSIVFNDKESLASSQSCCSIDADAWYKRTLTLGERGFLWLTPISVNTVYAYSVLNNGRLHYILVVILKPRNLMVLEPKLCADFI